MPGRRRWGPLASKGVAMVTGRANQWQRYSLAVRCTRHPGEEEKQDSSMRLWQEGSSVAKNVERRFFFF